ncbi:MAG TPA: SUMF1/EgtB/PvdO family nonheme iron enzyme [Thermoanaerobaculia bacterium]|jgi:formylglycine-generating enzyme required for sulfatase activity|nr:SUMF1/EgtB/PvdO family nonheme iron enzyme [Thermoanaerobaculia bacterium]
MSARRRRHTGYENFDLLIRGVPGGYQARVQDPGGGESHEDFPPPFAEGELRRILSSITGARRDLTLASVKRDDPLREVGTLLFQSVFRGDIEVSWRRRLKDAEAADKGLRLRLRLDADSPELWEWPWEYLYDPKREFLAVSPATPIIRYIEMAEETRPLRVAPPLRLLLITASPRGFAGLDIEQELAGLESTLAPLRKNRRIEVLSLRGAGRASLREHLRQTCHVLHFIGHGEGGALLLESPDGGADRVTGEELSLILRVQPRLRLVVLNACEGARGGDPSNPLASVAQALVKARIPAVVAMQFAISDHAALSFSRYFYDAIAAREPVDRAISEARNAMAVEQIPEWGTPVLAMRSPDGDLFGRSRREVLAAKARTIRNALSKRRLTVSALALASATVGLAAGARRWIDPNLLYSLLNPPDCPSPPGVPIAFVKIKPGNFVMGSDLAPEEEPPHEVTITRPFCISRFEVTESLWHRVMKENPRHSKGDRYPMVDVSWDDAWRFLSALRKIDPAGRFRLPWEIEWEYAAQADEPGPGPEAVKAYGNCGGKGIVPVGSYQPNAWGLYDVLGNVSEWVQDEYYPYSQETLERDSPSALGKVRRGGSFRNKDSRCTPTSRARSAPPYHGNNVGFRLVREPLSRK